MNYSKEGTDWNALCDLACTNSMFHITSNIQADVGFTYYRLRKSDPDRIYSSGLRRSSAEISYLPNLLQRARSSFISEKYE